jgi:ribose 1,5-bisphosphokinase PhnN
LLSPTASDLLAARLALRGQLSANHKEFETMKVKNVSARLHHVGDVSIAPGDIAEIDKSFAKAINTAELVEVVETSKPAKAAKAAEKVAEALAAGDAEAVAAALGAE